MTIMATFLIEDIFRIKGVGTVLVGKVEEGILRIGMKFNSNGKIMEVKFIEMSHKQVKEANQGDKVGINVRLNKSNESFLKKVFSPTNEEFIVLRDYKGKHVEFI
jgi:translation elongation factor EF-1alpha